MTAANYGPAERLVTALEGGYSNNPKDPGGATYRGITQRAYQDYRGRPCSIAELKAGPRRWKQLLPSATSAA